MKFLAIIDVTIERTIITLDKANVLDTNGTPITQAIMVNFVLNKNTKSSSDDVIEIWQQKEDGLHD